MLTTKPDRASPVAVSTKDIRVALSWNVAYIILLPAHMHLKGIVVVYFGERADPIGREKLVLVQHVLQNTNQSFFSGDGKEVEELSLVESVHVGNLCVLVCLQNLVIQLW